MEDINNSIKKFWEIESIDEGHHELSYSNKLFKETHYWQKTDAM